MKKSNYLFALALGASTLTFAQVGIGTSSPSSPLDIQADDAAIDLNSEAADGSRDPKINFQLTGTTTFSIGLDDADSDKLKIGVGAPETSTRMTIDGSGNVGIGTSSPSSLVEISSGTAGDAVLTISADTDDSEESDNPKLELLQDGGNYGGYVQMEGVAGTIATNTLANALLLGPSGTSGSTLSTVQLVTNGAARLTLEPSGEVGIGTNAPSEELEVNGQMRVESNGVPIAYFNRTTSDGWLLVFEGDGTTEGTISIAGSTVSYNAFTGSHYAYSKEGAFERGMLVSFNGNNEHLHNNPESEILYGINYTAKANDSKVAGVFLNLSESTKELSLDNPYQIMAVGNGDVWVTDEGGDIATGDYLISSSTVGHAMKDNGDYEVSHIFAKATESVDWSAVEPDSNGVKRKKIIVYFEAFDKPNYEKKFKEQQAIIEAQKKENESQKAEIESLKAEASSSSAETNQKLDANTSEIEALKAQVQQLLQLIQQQESASVVK